MHPRLSVIIPTKCMSSDLINLLKSLDMQSNTDFEVIISSNQSIGLTEIAHYASNLSIRLLVSDGDRSIARNKGAEISMTEVLLFLDSDMLVTSEVIAACVNQICEFDALCIHEQSSSTNYWSRALSLERDEYFGSLYFECSRCFKKSVFLKLNGYNPELSGLEDVDMQARLIENGYRIGWVDDIIIHMDANQGFLAYMNKRRSYSKADAVFSHAHPKYWTILKSAYARSPYLLRGLRKKGFIWSLKFLPGWAVTRFVELIFRGFIGS